MATTQSISPRFSSQTIRCSRAIKPSTAKSCVARCDAQDLRDLLAAGARICRSSTVIPSKSSMRRAKKAVQR
jgi:hypothetical protein